MVYGEDSVSMALLNSLWISVNGAAHKTLVHKRGLLCKFTRL